MRDWSPLRFVLVDGALTVVGFAAIVALVWSESSDLALGAVVVVYCLVSAVLAVAWARSRPPGSGD